MNELLNYLEKLVYTSREGIASWCCFPIVYVDLKRYFCELGGNELIYRTNLPDPDILVRYNGEVLYRYSAVADRFFSEDSLYYIGKSRLKAWVEQDRAEFLRYHQGDFMLNKYLEIVKETPDELIVHLIP
jgi:hypothetical protein